MYRAVIFDLDGTLLNTLGALAYCTNLVMDRWDLRHLSEEEMKKIVGDGYRMQIRRALLLAGDRELIHYEEALPLYMSVFSRDCMRGVVPYPGIPELLAKLKDRGIAIACFSNKPDAQTVENIEGIFGKGYFDVIRGAREGVPRKPDPAGALEIADLLGAPPSECLYLGDTNTDMETGRNAGMDTVGALWGFRDREELEAFHPLALAEGPAGVLAIALSGPGDGSGRSHRGT